jgi:hypothetical protein
MGNFSRDSLDQLKHYVGVRQQQGVPLVLTGMKPKVFENTTCRLF